MRRKDPDEECIEVNIIISVRTAHHTDSAICSYSAICVHKYKHYIPKAHLHTLVTERRTERMKYKYTMYIK